MAQMTPDDVMAGPMSADRLKSKSGARGGGMSTRGGGLGAFRPGRLREGKGR